MVTGKPVRRDDDGDGWSGIGTRLIALALATLILKREIVVNAHYMSSSLQLQ